MGSVTGLAPGKQSVAPAGERQPSTAPAGGEISGPACQILRCLLGVPIDLETFAGASSCVQERASQRSAPSLQHPRLKGWRRFGRQAVEGLLRR